MHSIMSDEEREEWRKTDEVAFELMEDKEMGDKLRKMADELYDKGEYSNRIEAFEHLLRNIIAEREEQTITDISNN